jgi:hypothetical protein
MREKCLAKEAKTEKPEFPWSISASANRDGLLPEFQFQSPSLPLLPSRDIEKILPPKTPDWILPNPRANLDP